MEKGKNTFKNYLYLNMDFLNSFIAQVDIKLETLDAKDEDDILARRIAASKYAKEVIELRESERMLNHFISRVKIACINPKCEESEKQLAALHINKYVKLETYYDYINLTRLETISDPAMRDFYSTTPRYNLFSGDKTELFSVDYVAKINQKMPILKKLFPFDTFFYAKEAIVLLNNSYLREQPSQIGYKFNNNYTVVGKVEKLATKERTDSMKPNKMLDGVQVTMLSVLKELGFLSEDDKNVFLINPIAIYNEIDLIAETE